MAPTARARGKSIRIVLLATALVVAVVGSLGVLLTSGRSAEAAFPGKNGRIAFCTGSGDSIYSVRPGGSGYRLEVPSASEYTCDPSYSPDGTKLAFTSDQDGDYDIYVKDLASGQVTQITNDGEDSGVPDRRPAWSPEGTKIVFDDQNDIWVMDATDGSDRMQLTDTATVSEWQATWSPNGTRIAFQREGDIWMMDPDGSDRKNLTSTPNRDDSFATWSPNSTRIAWARESGLDAPTDIWKMKADGSAKVRLTSFAGYDADPAWSPDGAKIAFIREGKIDTDVWKMSASDGSNKTNITNNDFDELDPDWQPKLAP
jgi:Tol biopolymer transport system component